MQKIVLVIMIFMVNIPLSAMQVPQGVQQTSHQNLPPKSNISNELKVDSNCAQVISTRLKPLLLRCKIPAQCICLMVIIGGVIVVLTYGSSYFSDGDVSYFSPGYS